MTKPIKELTKEDVLNSTGNVMAGMMFNIDDASYIRITSSTKDGGTASIWLYNPDKGNTMTVIGNREEAEHLDSLVPAPMSNLVRTVAMLISGDRPRYQEDEPEKATQ